MECPEAVVILAWFVLGVVISDSLCFEELVYVFVTVFRQPQKFLCSLSSFKISLSCSHLRSKLKGQMLFEVAALLKHFHVLLNSSGTSSRRCWGYMLIVQT